ncbi:hypothetical protein [Actinomarinicola tropica]|uniref:Uncharacterized protein n=1 Tax=Actinomarinicola tropica TaxID=2789776 RepID=A0A5Q2RL67_9ACTN|nr:hypothetical protein [Actinomarinicola tropica]QGG93925.1 hypothetical protein GH723_01720 [Actinomarinicola tropica]
MSPVERRTSRATTTAIVVALAGVVAGLGLVWFVVSLAGSGGDNVEIRLGDDRFPGGPAASRADTIADGGPILFADVAGGSRDILLHHVGEDAESGWYAVGAAPIGKERDCVLQWQADDAEFEDCDGDRFAIDDPGLASYPVTVEDGQLFVDLNAEFREEDEAPADDSPTEEPAADSD